MLHFNVNNWRQEQVVVLKVEQDNIAPPAVSLRKRLAQSDFLRASQCTIRKLPIRAFRNSFFRCVLKLTQNEHPLEGSISGDVIRELALRHDIFSSEEVNVWSMRGGTDVIFSVWDDDIAGVG